MRTKLAQDLKKGDMFKRDRFALLVCNISDRATDKRNVEMLVEVFGSQNMKNGTIRYTELHKLTPVKVFSKNEKGLFMLRD